MSETAITNETIINPEETKPGISKITEDQPNKSFFDDKTLIKQEKKESKELKESASNEFASKGSSTRKFNEPWNVHFTIGSKMFFNFLDFFNLIDYNIVIRFRKKEVRLLVVDSGKTHGASIKIEHIEFADYIVKGIEKEDEELIIYIDISPILEKLQVYEEKPIDFYVDTLEKNRYYAICGKGMIHRQLGSTKVSSGIDESILDKYKGLDIAVTKWTKSSDYQKVVINQTSLSNMLKSLTKKINKEKDKSTITTLYIGNGELNFVVQDEVEGSSEILSGEDMIVHPINEERIDLELKFLTKFGKLGLTHNPAIYLSNKLPVLYEGKFGGGRIFCHYFIAPRVDSE